MLDLPVMLLEDFLYDLIYAECKCKEFISGVVVVKWGTRFMISIKVQYFMQPNLKFCLEYSDL